MGTNIKSILAILALTVVFYLAATSYASPVTTRFLSNFTAFYPNLYGSDVTINATPSISANASNTSLSNGTLICSGIPIDFALANTSDFSLANTNVECPFSCDFRDTVSPLSLFPAPIAFMNYSDYSANITPYLAKTSMCLFYDTAQPANPLGPYTSSAGFYIGGTFYGSGRINTGLFCWWNSTITANGTVVVSGFIPSAVGPLLINYSIYVGNCSAFIRAYETDGATKDCIYKAPNSLFTSPFSDTLNLVITNGPNFTITGPIDPFIAAPGASVNISLPVKNVGEMNGTITNVTMDSGFTVTAFSPSQIDAGQSTTLLITVTVPGLGTYNPTVTLTYTSNTPVIGTCGNGTQNLSALGNVTGPPIIIIVTPTTPISPAVFATPSGILRDSGQWYPSKEVVISANITRPGSIGLLMSTTSNITVFKIDPVTEEDAAPAVARFCTSPGGDSSCTLFSAIPHYVSGTLDYQSIFLPFDVTAAVSGGNPSYFPLAPAVYRVELSVYDPAKAGTDQAMKKASAYFVIYTLTCAEKA